MRRPELTPGDQAHVSRDSWNDYRLIYLIGKVFGLGTCGSSPQASLYRSGRALPRRKSDTPAVRPYQLHAANVVSLRWGRIAAGVPLSIGKGAAAPKVGHPGGASLPTARCHVVSLRWGRMLRCATVSVDARRPRRLPLRGQPAVDLPSGCPRRLGVLPAPNIRVVPFTKRYRAGFAVGVRRSMGRALPRRKSDTPAVCPHQWNAAASGGAGAHMFHGTQSFNCALIQEVSGCPA